MTTQTLTKTCEPESSTQTQWRGHISCPPKKKDERLRKEKRLMDTLDFNRSDLHWKLVELVDDYMFS